MGRLFRVKVRLQTQDGVRTVYAAAEDVKYKNRILRKYRLTLGVFDPLYLSESLKYLVALCKIAKIRILSF